MASDLKIDIDGVRLNIRAGVIIRHENEVLIEISKIGRNSVIPGGRIKINEKSSAGLVRELKEELDFEAEEKKLKMKKVFENFFTIDGKDYHEIYFLYEYNISEEEFVVLNNSNINRDNETTYFKFISKNKLQDFNLLPLQLHDIIKM